MSNTGSMWLWLSKPMGSHSGVGEFTTHSTYFGGDWDVHWWCDLDFDPWPCEFHLSRFAAWIDRVREVEAEKLRELLKGASRRSRFVWVISFSIWATKRRGFMSFMSTNHFLGGGPMKIHGFLGGSFVLSGAEKRRTGHQPCGFPISRQPPQVLTTVLQFQDSPKMVVGFFKAQIAQDSAA